MESRTILMTGSGGREQALLKKLREDKRVGEIFIAPGNAGTGQAGTNVDIQATDINALLEFARQKKPFLTIFTGEDVLAEGGVDAFRMHCHRAFGPTKKAARIESSKKFSKELMVNAGILTAPFAVFTDYHSALAYVDGHGGTFRPCMIKASGLAQGKGAVACKTLAEAKQALQAMFVDKKFGEASLTVVIEKFLEGGIEFSAHGIAGGGRHFLFPFAMDHKKAFENDEGENTGGMGTIAPVFQSPMLRQYANDTIAKTLEQLESWNSRFEGCLYPGFMLQGDTPYVLEFNARFGDPETQVYMRLLESPLLDLFMYSANQDMSHCPEPKWRPGYAVCIMACAAGYPGPPRKGDVITGIEEAEALPDIVVYHSGTKATPEGIVTNGGRVLGVSAYADDLGTALSKAYSAMSLINFTGMHYRPDIGKRYRELR